MSGWGRDFQPQCREGTFVIILPGRKPNTTAVARHFHSAKPALEGFALNPVPVRRQGLLPMLRLSFGDLTPKEDRSIPELFRQIAGGPLNCQWIFPDTNVLTTAIQPGFWGIGQGRYLAFPEMTIAELSGWMTNPFHNAYLHSWFLRAVRLCQAEPVTEGGCYRVAKVLGTVSNTLVPFSLAIADKNSLKRFGYDYYVNLLSVRKRLGIAVARELQGKRGRAPTDAELKVHLNNRYHPRIASIALKGWKDQGKRNYLADEELVVTAALTAILSGTETLTLTWDTDVFDQFAKLMECLAADYACFRFSEVLYHNPDGCLTQQMDVPRAPKSRFGFVGDKVEHVVMPYAGAERLPPSDYTPVQSFCVLLGNNCVEPKVSTVKFCLEKEMAYMLNVKGRTRGLNTDRFPGRNIIAGTYNKHQPAGALFVLGNQEYVNYEGLTMSWFDVQRALKSGLPHEEWTPS